MDHKARAAVAKGKVEASSSRDSSRSFTTMRPGLWGAPLAVRTASLRLAVPVPTALVASSVTHLVTSPLPGFAFGGAVQTRNSAKRGGGTTKNNRNSAGRRLGVKRSGCA